MKMYQQTFPRPAVTAFAVHWLWLIMCLSMSPVMAQTSATQSLPRVVFLGDSLTAGYQLDPELAYPRLVGDLLEKHGVSVHAINAGVSGDTSAGGLRRINWLLRQPIDVLIIALGANDALRGQSPEFTKSNLSQIVQQTRENQPDVKILLVGMLAPPNMGNTFANQFNAIYPALAEKHNLSLMPFLLADVAGIDALNLTDGIHPNAAGHKRIAENILPFLLQLLSAVDE